MTNEEEIRKVIEHFSNKEIIFRRGVDRIARIEQVIESPIADNIRVRLIFDYTRYWTIYILISDRTVNWLWSEGRTGNWDLIMDDISFKRCIKNGLYTPTLYDLI